MNTSLLEDSLLFLRLGGRGGGCKEIRSSSIDRDTSSAVGTLTLDTVDDIDCVDWVVPEKQKTIFEPQAQVN